jgi:hypothetical protein
VTGFVRLVASRALSGASRLLPRRLAIWGHAMERELGEIPDDAAAARFAAGCLRTILTLAIAERLRSILTAPPIWSHPAMHSTTPRPRLLGLVCGVTAVALGIAYMAAAGAPSRYILMNVAALVLGASLWLALGRAAGPRLPAAGPASLVLAASLLLTALFGIAFDGAARWVRVGPLNLQVSLIVLPLMLVLYARRPDPLGTIGMAVAALALALQPDPAMAGVLAAGLLALLAADRSRLPLVASTAALLGFAWTLLTPDRLPAVPYVDRVLYSAFDVHPLAGLAVLVGAAALVVPAAVGAWKPGADRPVLLAFGACWAGVVVAAALGNYPTPLVGYGGSAVLGYLLSVALLPNARREAGAAGATESIPAESRISDPSNSELRAAHLA